MKSYVPGISPAEEFPNYSFPEFRKPSSLIMALIKRSACMNCNILVYAKVCELSVLNEAHATCFHTVLVGKYSSMPGMKPISPPSLLVRVFVLAHSLRRPMASLRRRERWSASRGGIHLWTAGTGRRREWWKSGTSSCSTTFARRRDELLL